ncbi:VapC toxin family PIN domain ribonuclease [Rhodoblastus sphagnicola]|uniref:Ribonuclease VapC n=1 Tax=Rhodoblastus sphagnicola TaxID=333368 RepID=A0A2S6MZM0_9HYPH|nr:PIN domain-containing protein [Rhodoblastus sphagnicola]MBB4201067.1 putative nucleic acid-binding protein [Rhodoblastus sphagnicola]PPQ27825.1 VapC toxin family PIN domain ribonuclease [Rhodoblastus sphagnicola]
MTAFFDTNVLICAQEQGAKADKARALLAAGGILSVQVLNEFTAVARRKLGKDWGEIGEAIEDALTLLDPPLPLTVTLHKAARSLADDHKVSFYDALIVAAALEADCETLFSEDLQNGRAFGKLKIVNPFV